MSAWAEGGILSGALILGGAIGWFFGKLTRLRMPNLWVSFIVLTFGSLGGPLVTFKFLGQNLVSFCLALVIAGFAAGWVFWPMGETQGEKEWL